MTTSITNTQQKIGSQVNSGSGVKGEYINSEMVREDYKLTQEMAGLPHKENKQLREACWVIFVVCKSITAPRAMIKFIGLDFFPHILHS